MSKLFGSVCAVNDVLLGLCEDRQSSVDLRAKDYCFLLFFSDFENKSSIVSNLLISHSVTN